jgi:putative heme-binding domain-containing protein
MELGLATPLEKMSVIGARPQHDTFGIDNAMLVFPGDPKRSIIYERLSRRGRGQMPPLVVATTDNNAVALFREWISSMRAADNYIREWTMDDLVPSLPQLATGRSIEAGKAAFTSAGCVQCHKFGAAGGSVGPDLTAVGSRLAPQGILESIVLPSKVIADGYAATEIETRAGEAYSGRVASEDAVTVTLQPATATAEPIVIRKTEIKSRSLSKTSNMPTGLANTLRRDQILDLIAFLTAQPRPPGR